jgi:NADH-ubiquinone oxidoreductase chain 4
VSFRDISQPPPQLKRMHISPDRRLIPTLFFILGWGYQPERVQAGIYVLLYTLLASLLLLVATLFVYNYFNSSCLFLLCDNNSLVGGLFYAYIVLCLCLCYGSVL